MHLGRHQLFFPRFNILLKILPYRIWSRHLCRFIRLSTFVGHVTRSKRSRCILAERRKEGLLWGLPAYYGMITCHYHWIQWSLWLWLSTSRSAEGTKHEAHRWRRHDMTLGFHVLVWGCNWLQTGMFNTELRCGTTWLSTAAILAINMFLHKFFLGMIWITFMLNEVFARWRVFILYIS